MILFHAKRDGTVTTTPNFVPQGSSMQDLVVVSEFDYAYCAIKLLPASGEYIEDVPCTPIPQKDFSTIFTAALPPKATVVAGSVDYQLIFTAADGATQTTLVGSFTVPRGVPVSTPGSVEELSVKTVGDLYAIMANTYGLFAGHEGDITKNKTEIAQNKTNITKNTTDIAALKKTVSSAGYVTIPTAKWNDGTPTIAEFTLDGFGAGMTAMLIPADSNTQTAAREARLSAYPVAFPIDGDTQTVEIIRADADKAPEIPLRFAYLILKAADTSVAPSVAIIGVDAYGEGGGAASGVDETAVKKIITAMLGNVENERQYSAENPPPYPVTSVNGKTGAVNLNAADVGARPSTWMPTASDVKADPVGTAEAEIKTHNTDNAAHEYIQQRIDALRTLIENFLDIDDKSFDQLSEILRDIRANTSALELLGTNKVDKTAISTSMTDSNPEHVASMALIVALDNALTVVEQAIEDLKTNKQTAEQVYAAINNALSGYLTSVKAAELYQPKGDYLTPETGDARYAKPSDIPTVPQTLPNPYALTILGKTYTGGKAVSLTAEELMEAIKTASGGVVAYLDGNKLVLSGNLPDATYTAYYEVNGELIEIGDLTLGSITPDPVTYTIKWVNYDGTVLETDEKVAENTVPTYDGATPTRAADNDYTYTFSGWADEKGNVGVVAATANAIYTAVYDKTAKPVEPDPDPIKPKNFATPSAWVQKGRIRSNGEVATDADKTTYATDFVDCQNKDVIYISNAKTNHNLYHGSYNSSKGVLGAAAYNGSNDYFVFSDTTDTSATVTIKSSSVAYMRFTLGEITDTKKVVINIKRNGEWRTK